MSIEERLELQACERARAKTIDAFIEQAVAAALVAQKAERELLHEAISHLSDTTLSASKREQCRAWLQSNPERCVALVGER